MKIRDSAVTCVENGTYMKFGGVNVNFLANSFAAI